MATLYKRGKAYYINWSKDGEQFRRSLGPIEKREAEAIRAEKEAELAGLILPTRGVLVADVIAPYLNWYRTARPTTYRRAVSALSRFQTAFDHVAAESLPAALIEQWAAQQTAKGQTEKALKLARAAFRRAVRQRQIGLSPMDGVTIPKSVTSRAPPYFTREQLGALARQPRGAAWVFMAATGVRRGEIVKARQADIRDGVLLVESAPEGRTKSGKWRAIPLSPHARRAVARLGADRLVTCHADTLGDWFRAEASAAGVAGTLHWLRHTFCTMLAQSGVSLHEIKRLAGHSSITVTEQYAHHAPDYGRAAVATMARWGKPKRGR